MRFEHQRHRLTRRIRRSGSFGLAVAVGIGLGFGFDFEPGFGGAAGVALAQSVDGPPRASLDVPDELLGASTFRAAGFDPEAPRPLVLWRFDGRALERLAEAHSGPDGRFDFGLQPLPIADADFGVTGPGESPDPGPFRRTVRAVPAPIVASDEAGSAEGPRTLFVRTARAEGELWIRDHASGRLLARTPVVIHSKTGTPIDLERWLPSPGPASITLEHRLDDGRVSAPEIWVLESPGTARP